MTGLMGIEIRQMSTVKRWSIMPTLRVQNVAEHSYYVVVYCTHFIEALEITDPELRHAIVNYALFHDIEEIFTGDVPSTAKKYVDIEGINRDLVSMLGLPRHRISPVKLTLVKNIIKAADLADALIFCYEELRMGNTIVEKVIGQLEPKMLTAIQKLPWPNSIGQFDDYVIATGFLNRLKEDYLKGPSET